MLSYVKLCCLFYLFQERVLVVFSQSQLIKQNSTRPPSRHMEPKESVSSVFSVSDSKEARYGRSNLGQPDLDEPVTPSGWAQKRWEHTASYQLYTSQYYFISCTDNRILMVTYGDHFYMNQIMRCRVLRPALGLVSCCIPALTI